ncbi:MAG: hypothetical protein LBH43_21780 [Treponema sp.]|jgi:hypothetical protein|nr:hypothetical protein [Treponema sp.]
MVKQWDYNRCIAILNQETALLNKIYAVQNSVRQAVLNHEWADFDWKMAEIRQIGREFGQLDEERDSLFTALAMAVFGFPRGNAENQAAPPPFYALASRLPEEERRELTRLYRVIKIETLRMQALNESFLNFLNEARSSASAYLEAAFPSRWGKLYTKKGGQTAQDLKSMVFNQHI